MKKIFSSYIVENGILYKRYKDRKLLVVPETKLNKVLEAIHDHPMAGHMGIENTFNRVKENYYWKTMWKDIEHYVKSCDTCQKRKLGKETEELHPVKVNTAFSKLGIDIVALAKNGKRKQIHSSCD